MRDWVPFTATVTKTYNTPQGVLVCDLYRAGSPARTLTGVPVLVMGGGERSFCVPPDVGAEVVVGFTADAYSFPSPFVMGAWSAAAMGLSPNAQANEPEADTADSTLDAASIPLQNAGGQVVIDGHGATRVTPAPGQPFRAELTDAGEMLVSRDGEASDRAALTSPLVQLLAQWQTAIGLLQAAVVAIGAAQTPPITYTPTTLDTPLVEDLGSAVLRVSAQTPANEGVDPES